MITGDKLDTLERWLFNYTEPPFEEKCEILAVQYKENLEYLKRVEYDRTWDVSDLECTPDEIREVIESRMKWIDSHSK